MSQFSSSTIQIQPCQMEDLPGIQNLLKQLEEVTHSAPSIDLSQLKQMHIEMQKAPQFYLNLVCKVDGKIAGFISLVFYKTFFHKGGTALINELIIDKNYRGLGLGKKLIEQARQEALSRKMDEMEVGAENNNLNAQQFYRACGFNEEYMLLGMEFE